MSAKRTRTVKTGRSAKKGGTRRVRRQPKGRFLVLSAAALVVCAGMVIGGQAYQTEPATAVTVAEASSVPVPASVSRVLARSTPADPMTPADPAASDSTHVGCLRTEDGNKFVLTDIDGKDEPKSRNWKTLFVTKKSGKLAVTPAAGLNLRPHVGQTVQLTGKRGENALAARSLKVVRPTCS